MSQLTQSIVLFNTGALKLQKYPTVSFKAKMHMLVQRCVRSNIELVPSGIEKCFNRLYITVSVVSETLVEIAIGR